MFKKNHYLSEEDQDLLEDIDTILQRTDKNDIKFFKTLFFLNSFILVMI